MAYTETLKKINDGRSRISEILGEMRELQAAIEPERVEDYEFATAEGSVRLSQLFGNQEDLFVVHNMGASCRYCTLWADGFNGLVDHLENRAGFVVSSPDAPDAQLKFANSRGWRFRMVSHAGTSFAQDMGYFAAEGDHTGWQPGISAFRKDGDRIVRVSDTPLGPGDVFCAAWHIFGLLPAGADGWEPRYNY
jgi:predicted dithiol-disulfide oxidoreductase (DUF899 family)